MKRTVRIIFALAACLLALAPSTLASPVPAAAAQYPDPVTIEGTVTGNASQPLPGSIVIVGMVPNAGSPYRKWFTREAVTDVNGHYSIPIYHLWSGPYKGYIKVMSTGYETQKFWPTTPAWEEGETYQFDVPMSSASENYEKWVGLRNSWYGATDPTLPEEPDTFPYPIPEEWGNAVHEMDGYVDAERPTLLLIVGEVVTENPTDGGVRFWFPQPAGVPDYHHITYQEQTGLDIEALLDHCDDNGIEVFLQVEPGYANISTLINIVMPHVAIDDETGELHPSVAGFGVDLEWHQDSDITCNSAATCGKQMSDVSAWIYERVVQQYGPDLQLLLKHFARIDYPAWNKFPPEFKGDIIFVNDSQKMGSLSNCVGEMEMFADFYAPNDVMFQQGYKDDYAWWKDLGDPIPGTFGEALFDAGNPGQAVGFLWVDFTMRKVLDSFGAVPYSWVAGASYDVGDQAIYNGSTWECVYAHAAQANWYPGAPGLWFWSQVPEGNEWVSGKAYTVGDVATYNGSTWECVYAHTSYSHWYPGAPGLWFWVEQ